MGIDLVDYLTLPSSDEWRKYIGALEEKFSGIEFTTKCSFDLSEMINGNYEENFWKEEFNWRVFNIGNNFVLMMHFYDKGINDEVYDNLKGVNSANHIWFSFYAESLLARIIGAYDVLFHIVNIKYNLNVKKNSEFKRKVLEKLKPLNGKLYNLLNTLRFNKTYKKIVALRNDFVHNNTPTNLDSGLSIKKQENKTVYSFGKGKYVKSKDIVNVINESFEHLQSTINEFEKSL